MIRPLECFVGLRYLRTGQGRGFVSFMSVASLLGITLGVASIIVILSAMNGLETETRSRLLSMADHVTVRPDIATADLGRLSDGLGTVAGVAEVNPFVRLEVILLSGSRYRGVVVRGIDPAREAPSSLGRVVGPERLQRLAPGGNGILLGRFVAAELGVQPGDQVEVLLPAAEAGMLRPRRAAARVTGVFAAGVEEHDANLGLMHIVDAAAIGGIGRDAEGLSVRLDEPMSVARVEQALRASAGPGYRWSNWAVENRSLFRAMAIEKTMMTILMLFIVAVAAFNIVTSLTMTVNEKARDIAVLRTLGLESGRVTRIFLVQGAVIGIGGTLLGVALGLLLALNLETVLPWAEQTFGFRIMPGDVFYVTDVPSEIRPRDLIVIPGIALLIALLATIPPSRKAARVDPAEALRYE